MHDLHLELLARTDPERFRIEIRRVRPEWFEEFPESFGFEQFSGVGQSAVPQDQFSAQGVFVLSESVEPHNAVLWVAGWEPDEWFCWAHQEDSYGNMCWESPRREGDEEERSSRSCPTPEAAFDDWCDHNGIPKDYRLVEVEGSLHLVLRGASTVPLEHSVLSRQISAQEASIASLRENLALAQERLESLRKRLP